MSFNPIKKRKYSRNGCYECKRRKIKCDELSEKSCGNCLRIEIPCVYPSKDAPKKPRKPRSKNPVRFQQVNANSFTNDFADVKDKILRQISSNASPESDSSSTSFGAPSQDQIPTATSLEDVHVYGKSPIIKGSLTNSNNDDLLSFDNIWDDANNLVHGLADFNVFDTNIKNFSDNSLKPFHSNIILNADDADSLFKDLDIESYIQNPNPGVAEFDSNSFWREKQPLISGNSPKTNKQEAEKRTNLDLIEKIIQIYKLNEVEIGYLKDITYSPLAFYIYPFGTSVEDDKVIRILLEYMVYFKYLTYATVALGASCKYNMTGDKHHDAYLRKYITICMKLLVVAFSDLKNNKHFLRSIEGLVLTVIVLAMIFADVACLDLDNVSDSWTSHLNGARDLLIKYKKIKQQDGGKDTVDSPGITLAKLLFFNYDWLSKLALPPSKLREVNLERGAFLDPCHVGFDKNPQNVAALQKMGILTPKTMTLSGFNLYLSLSEELANCIEELVLLAKKAAGTDDSNYNQVSPSEVWNFMSLLEKASRQQVVPLMTGSPRFMIPENSPGHPNYPDYADKLILPDGAYEKDWDENGRSFYISTCDASQRVHTYALYLKVLTTPGLLYLPKRHPMIKETINKCMETMYFLKPKSDPNYKPENVLKESQNYYLVKHLFNFKIVMTQLTFRMCSDLTDNLDDFEKLELYFQGMLELCTGSALHALDRLRKNREASIERHKKRQAIGKESKTDVFDESDYKYSVEAYPIY